MLYFVLLTINSNLTSLNSRFKRYFHNSDTSTSKQLTTDVLENGLYLAIMQESENASNRGTPSFAMIYINNGMWINWQKASGTEITSITHSGGKITFTMSADKFLLVCMVRLGS